MGLAIIAGTAGWAIRRQHQDLFESGRSHLARYATRLCGVEINSSFYRPHRPATYAKWAASVPADFRFAVKIPRAITHEARLAGAEGALEAFLAGCTALGDRLGPLLIQLPPSLEFDEAAAFQFLTTLRALTRVPAVIEPRHASWFTSEANVLLSAFLIARVAADPPPKAVPQNRMLEPGGDRSTAYFRLHGSPNIYYSDYSDGYLRALAERLRAEQNAGSQVWCIFDNTALGHATENAITLKAILERDTA